MNILFSHSADSPNSPTLLNAYSSRYPFSPLVIFSIVGKVNTFSEAFSKKTEFPDFINASPKLILVVR